MALEKPRRGRKRAGRSAWVAVLTVALLGTGGTASDGKRVHAGFGLRASDGLSASSRLQEDVADGWLDEYDFFDAALIASGVESVRQRELLRRRFDLWWNKQAQTLRRIPEPRAKARALLHALHRDLLRGQYYAACARVDQTLNQGHFNCVTATVLYHEAARRAGWDAQIVSVPGHVFNRLILASGTLDVQSTSATWLDPGAPRADVPGGQPRILSEVQLLGKLYYNRGVTRLAQHRFAQAARHFRTALVYDPQDESAAQNLLAALNNGALAAAQQRRFEQALAWLAEGLQVDPQFAPLAANYRHVAETGVRQLLAEARPEAARRILHEAAQAGFSPSPWLARQRNLVARWQPTRSAGEVADDGGWERDVDLTSAAP